MLLSFIMASAFSFAFYLVSAPLLYAITGTAGGNDGAVTFIFSLIYPLVFSFLYLLVHHIVSSKGYNSVVKDYRDESYSVSKDAALILKKERAFFILTAAVCAFSFLTFLLDVALFGGRGNVISYAAMPFIALTMPAGMSRLEFPITFGALFSSLPLYLLSALIACAGYFAMLLFARRIWYKKHLALHRD